MKHTISALVENKFGVLARVAGMFSGRGFNIETLNVGPVNEGKYSRITATVKDDKNSVEQCVHQLSKLVNVIDVIDFSTSETFVSRELALLKVKFTEKNHKELLTLIKKFNAKIACSGKSTMIIEITDESSIIEELIVSLKKFNILEMARTGALALDCDK